MVFAYHSILVHRVESRNIFICITVVGHCVTALLSSFTSSQIEGPVEYIYGFEGATAVTESGIYFLCRKVCVPLQLILV